MENVKKTNLLEGSLLSKIILFSLPLAATSLLQLLFNTADTVVVGRWGGDTQEACENALAAVGSCAALINLIIKLMFGLSVGAGVCIAHGIGARRYDDVEKVTHTSVILAAITGFATAVFGVLLARPLLWLMGTDAAVIDEAVPYMQAYFCGVPANLVYTYCATMLRSCGDTTRPLAFLSVAGIANVGLNLVMVIGFRQGALGVGVATAVSQWLSCVLILIYMSRADIPCKLKLSKLKIDVDKVKKILGIGLPAGIQATVFSFSNVLIQSSVNSLGKVAVAAKTAAANLDGYVYMVQNTAYQCVMTFTGQMVGAREEKRLKRCIFYCYAFVVAVWLIFGGGELLFAKQLLGIYAPGNAPVIETGQIYLWIIVGPYFLCGFMDVGCGVLRGFGRSVTSMIISLVGSCVTRVIWIYTIFQIPSCHTLEVLLLSYPISWALTALTHFLFWRVEMKKYRQELARASASPAPSPEAPVTAETT